MKKEMIYVGVGPMTAGEDMCAQAKIFGQAMAEMGWTLRSGGAEGLDEAFERGALEGNGKTEIFIPSADFRKRFKSSDKVIHTLDKHIEAMREVAPLHENWSQLGTTVQMFLTRIPFCLFGEKLDKPAHFVVGWSKHYPHTGAGIVLKMAEMAGIPAFNLAMPGQMDAVEDFVYKIMEG